MLTFQPEQGCPSPNKPSLMLTRRPLRCPKPGWALGDPKSLLQSKRDPEGVRLVDASCSPIFLHLDPGFWLLCPLGGCCCLYGAENVCLLCLG